VTCSLCAPAEKTLVESMKQPGSTFGSLYSASQPLLDTFPSWSAAGQALKQLRSTKDLSGTSHAASQLLKQLQSLHLGQLLLRCELVPHINVWMHINACLRVSACVLGYVHGYFLLCSVQFMYRSHVKHAHV